MKINKTLLLGIILILFGGLLLVTDVFTPYIRPILYLMLMGSTKGKDIIFFILFGLFVILSQLKLNVNNNKFLKLTIIFGLITLIIGLILEIAMRIELGLKWNTIFVATNPNMCSTSLIHTHIYKSIFGNFFNTYLPNVTGINEARCLFRYIPAISSIFIIFFPIIFILQVLAIQKRNFASLIHLAIFFPCLLIGILDGGLFATPSYFGIIGSFLILRNSYFIEKNFKRIIPIKDKYEVEMPKFRKFKKNKIIYLKKRFLPYIFLFILLVLRFGILYIGADTSCYEVILSNPKDNIDIINEYKNINITNDSTHYYLSPDYNEMELLISLKFYLNHKCDYYTLSWNGFSYL